MIEIYPIPTISKPVRAMFLYSDRRITSPEIITSISVLLLIGCGQTMQPVDAGPETGLETAVTSSKVAPVADRIDPRALVTKADVESVMERSVDAPTMQSEGTCIYRTLPWHYNVEVLVIPNSNAAQFQRSREAAANVTAIEPVESIGDEAYWIPNDYRFYVRTGNVAVMITTVLPVKEQTTAGQKAARVQRLEAAKILARKAIDRIAKGQTTYMADPNSANSH